MTNASVPPFVGPQGERGEDLLIVWDIQNVRVPVDLPPDMILRHFYEQFVVKPGPRRCCGCYCTFTDSTKRAIGERRFNALTSNGVLNCHMLNVPGGDRKVDDADHPLKEVMLNFTVDCIKAAKNGVILLITGDADFVRPAVWCKQQGCVKLELLYYDPCAAMEIKNMYCSWSMEWRDFLDRMVGERRQWIFPYPDRSSDDDSSSPPSPTGRKYARRNPHHYQNRLARPHPSYTLRHGNKRFLAGNSYSEHRQYVPGSFGNRNCDGMLNSAHGAHLLGAPPANNMLPEVHDGSNSRAHTESFTAAAGKHQMLECSPDVQNRPPFLQRLLKEASDARGTLPVQLTGVDTLLFQPPPPPPPPRPATLAVMVPRAVNSSLTTASPPSSPPSSSSSDRESPDCLAAGKFLKGVLNVPTVALHAAVPAAKPAVGGAPPVAAPPVRTHTCMPVAAAASGLLETSVPAITPPAPLELPSPQTLSMASKSLQRMLGVKPAGSSTSVAGPSQHGSPPGAVLLTPQHLQATTSNRVPGVVDTSKLVTVTENAKNPVLMGSSPPGKGVERGVSALLTPALVEATASGAATACSAVRCTSLQALGLHCGLLTPQRVKDPWMSHNQPAALLTPSHVTAQVCDG